MMAYAMDQRVRLTPPAPALWKAQRTRPAPGSTGGYWFLVRARSLVNKTVVTNSFVANKTMLRKSFQIEVEGANQIGRMMT